MTITSFPVVYHHTLHILNHRMTTIQSDIFWIFFECLCCVVNWGELTLKHIWRLTMNISICTCFSMDVVYALNTRKIDVVPSLENSWYGLTLCFHVSWRLKFSCWWHKKYAEPVGVMVGREPEEQQGAADAVSEEWNAAGQHTEGCCSNMVPKYLRTLRIENSGGVIHLNAMPKLCS